jgi:hypothetical protein
MSHLVNGTREEILRAYRENAAYARPAFALICCAPCSAMIGTDMNEAARAISAEHGLPAAYVDISGHKTYDYGISKTLEALAKLLPEDMPMPASGKRDGFNLFGGTALDWSADNLADMRRVCEKMGPHLVSAWGSRERGENLRRSSGARLNLVVTASGLSAAKYMRERFDQPYIAGAPFGKSWSERIHEALKTGVQPEAEMSGNGKCRYLIIGEQFLSNAIRNTLRMDYGAADIRTAGFFMPDDDCMEQGDVRLKGEDDLKKLLGESEGCCVIADPLYRRFAASPHRWLDLYSNACFAPPEREIPSLVGEKLNRWLEYSL